MIKKKIEDSYGSSIFLWGEVYLFYAKKTTPETVVPEDKSSFKATAVSDADGAKVIKIWKLLQKNQKN